jgi:hypothetical protein
MRFISIHDPLQLSYGFTKLAQAVNKANEWIIPLAIATDLVSVVLAASEDFKNGTSRNTVETTAKIASAWTGGLAGKYLKTLSG